MERIDAMVVDVQSFYEKNLQNYPNAVKGIQTSILMVISDIIAQHVSEDVPFSEIDWVRTAQFGVIGLFFVGPALSNWYEQLEASIDPEDTPFRQTLKKLAMDQLIFAPCFLAVLTTAVSAIQGLSPDEIGERLKNEYPQIIKKNYLIWPAAQVLNYSVIPTDRQVLFAEVVSVVVNTYFAVLLLNTKNEGKSSALVKSFVLYALGTLPSRQT